MKKLLGLMVLGLMLSSNVSLAATKFTYLSCKSVVLTNESKGKYKDSEFLKKGSYVGHFFFKFKDVKKKTTVTVYEQGNTITEDWMNYKPKQVEKKKFDYDKSSKLYIYAYGNNDSSVTWAITRHGGDQYHHMHMLKLGKLGVKITTLSQNRPSDNRDICEAVDKKKFNELIKNGIY